MSDSLMQNFTPIFKLRDIQQNAAHVLPFLTAESRVLDVGCGEGSITFDFARRCPSGSVVGIDISEDMIRVAKETASKDNSELSNINFAVGNAVDLSSYDADSFDIVHAHQILTHLTNPVQAVKEMHRIVKPGGVVAVRDFVGGSHVCGAPILEKSAAQYQKISRERGAEPEGGKFNHIWMREGGFLWSQIDMGTVAWEFSGEERRKMWAETCKRSLSMMGGQQEALVEDMRKAWEEWAENAAARYMAMDGWVVGRK